MVKIYKYITLEITLVFVIFSFSVNNLAWAQPSSTTAAITGRVTDEENVVIPGIITAKNLQTNFVREIRSDKEGTFSIGQLPLGSYELSIQTEGFTTKTSCLELVLGTTTVCPRN